MVNRAWSGGQDAFRRVLKNLRISLDVTQSDLADKLEYPQSYVSKYESGERKLDYLEVKAIVNSLGMTIGEFDALLDLTDQHQDVFQNNSLLTKIKTQETQR
jgi:transcriptional regulator with XRE-family HTH domain